jgi:hypothetical protein
MTRLRAFGTSDHDDDSFDNVTIDLSVVTIQEQPRA